MRFFFKTKAIEFNFEISQRVLLAIILGVTPSDILIDLQSYLSYFG
jgi:hypothetical protein